MSLDAVRLYSSQDSDGETFFNIAAGKRSSELMRHLLSEVPNENVVQLLKTRSASQPVSLPAPGGLLRQLLSHVRIFRHCISSPLHCAALNMNDDRVLLLLLDFVSRHCVTEGWSHTSMCPLNKLILLGLLWLAHWTGTACPISEV